MNSGCFLVGVAGRLELRNCAAKIKKGMLLKEHPLVFEIN